MGEKSGFVEICQKDIILREREKPPREYIWVFFSRPPPTGPMPQLVRGFSLLFRPPIGIFGGSRGRGFPQQRGKTGKQSSFENNLWQLAKPRGTKTTEREGKGRWQISIYSEVYVSRSSGKGKEKKDDISKSGAQLLFSRKAPRLKTK